jgi:hypothetical protein
MMKPESARTHDAPPFRFPTVDHEGLNRHRPASNIVLRQPADEPAGRDASHQAPPGIHGWHAEHDTGAQPLARPHEIFEKLGEGPACAVAPG